MLTLSIPLKHLTGVLSLREGIVLWAVCFFSTNARLPIRCQLHFQTSTLPTIHLVFDSLKIGKSLAQTIQRGNRLSTGEILYFDLYSCLPSSRGWCVGLKLVVYLGKQGNKLPYDRLKVLDLFMFMFSICKKHTTNLEFRFENLLDLCNSIRINNNIIFLLQLVQSLTFYPSVYL